MRIIPIFRSPVTSGKKDSAWERIDNYDGQVAHLEVEIAGSGDVDASELIANPRIGEQLFQFEPHEVRRILVRKYEVLYEIQDLIIYVLRLWHTREDR
jgi:hypothetical protein